MKKVMIICLYAAFVCASDHNDATKEIDRLKKLARVANKNGLATAAESYLRKADQLLAQEQAKKSDANIQQAQSNK